MFSGAVVEGYMSLIEYKHETRERDTLQSFYTLQKDYARKNGSKEHFLLNPNLANPSKHQYDYDCETGIGFYANMI
jgi:xylose isomerase